MKLLGEWIPQSSNQRNVMGYIDGSEENGYGGSIKYFHISRNGVHKVWGSKISSLKINSKRGN